MKAATTATLAVRACAAANEHAIAGAAVAVIAIACGGLLLALGSRTASGADAFGYVSQAYLWADGALTAAHPHVPLDGIDYPDRFISPLGYGPGLEPDTYAPVYPPGLPLLMASLLIAFGDRGPFLVGPLSAAMLVVATYLLGRRFQTPLAGVGAALLMAVSPALLFVGLLPMSDALAAGVWTLSMATAHGSRARGAAAGMLAGLGIAIRPNLAPLAVAAILLIWQETEASARRRWSAFALFALAAAPGLALVLWLNYALRGSPFASGYGSLAELYSLSFIPDNIVNYTGWFVASQGLALAAFAAAGCVYGFAVRRLRALALATAIVCASYAAYLVFGAWWFLRFLLPAFPAMFVLALAVGGAGLARLPPRVRAATAFAGFLFLSAPGAWFAATSQLQELRHQEHRYAAAGAVVRAALPSNAAYFTMQHSGALRYYAGRLTVRYDWLKAGDLARARDTLAAAGYEPYFLIDAPEEAAVRARFTQPGDLAFLDAGPVIELRSTPSVRVYRMRGVPSGAVRTAFVEPGWPSIVPPVHRPPLAWDPPPAALPAQLR